MRLNWSWSYLWDLSYDLASETPTMSSYDYAFRLAIQDGRYQTKLDIMSAHLLPQIKCVMLRFCPLISAAHH